MPIEIKVREQDAKLLLAYYAALSGFTVVIGEQLRVEKASMTLPQGIYFSKGYPNHYKKRLVAQIKNTGHHFVELDEEGLIIHDKARYLSDRMNPSLNSRIDHVYCWGDDQYDLIKNSSTPLTKKIFKTGNPRFDLLSKKYRGLYLEQAPTNKSFSQTILINTRFALYNSIQKSKTALNEHEQYMKRLFNHFIKLVNALSKSYPSLQFIVRPHPAENQLTYKRAFTDLKNVRVTTKGNVITSILSSDMIIHNGCTTGIEAFLLDKPVINYQPVTHSKFDVNLPNDVSVKATSIEEVKQMIDESYTETSPSNHLTEKHNKLKQYYHFGEAYAFEQIIHKLQQLPKLTHPQNNRKIKPTNYQSKSSNYRFPYFTEKEIHHFFKKLNQIERQNHSFHIQKLDHLVYKITKENR